MCAVRDVSHLTRAAGAVIAIISYRVVHSPSALHSGDETILTSTARSGSAPKAQLQSAFAVKNLAKWPTISSSRCLVAFA